MDKVGVRQAGGLGGDRPVVRLVGLNTDSSESVRFQVSRGTFPNHKPFPVPGHDNKVEPSRQHQVTFLPPTELPVVGLRSVFLVHRSDARVSFTFVTYKYTQLVEF